MNHSTDFDFIRQDWHHKTGSLPFPMTNDYSFRALCQKDSVALKSLICSILHWEREQIVSTEVTNPIMLGKAIDDKEFVLDVHILMNNNITLNLEMQVLNEGNWPQRSLLYLCRQYDQLCCGEGYKNTKTAIHIGILSFDPFKGESSLRDSYRMMNDETQQLYTDKFQLYTLILPHAGQADAEDVRFHTDAWARCFTAKTWEDLKMAAKDDDGIASAVSSVHALWEDDEVRARIQAREDYYRQRRWELEQLAEAEKKIAEAEKKSAEAEKELVVEKKKNQELQAEIDRLRQLLAEK